MADTLRRMLDIGKLTDEQCLAMLRMVGEEESKEEEEEAVLVEKCDKTPMDNRKPLQELLDMRKMTDEEKGAIYNQIDEEDLGQDPDYCRQILDSQGFDFSTDVLIPLPRGRSPFYFHREEQPPPNEMVLYALLGVHWFNFQNKRNLKFIRIPKLNTDHPFPCSFFITVEVKDVDSDSYLTLQTKIGRPYFPKFDLFMERCRIKPTTAARESYHFSFFRHTEFSYYYGRMPDYMSEPPTTNALRFYEVQEKDICENYWLRLYTEIALYQVCEAGSHPFLPDKMKINKILVETEETFSTNPSLKLKYFDAIFHISFTANHRDYTAVVRRTTDGNSGHMRLEDTVIDAGKYDGSLGIISAISALKVPPVEVRLVIYLRRIIDGISVQDALKENSIDITEENLMELKYDSASVWGYVEVHIEQGPVLEWVGYPLGVVKGIAGQTRLKVTVKGTQGHAGTVPMSMRQDPMTGAAEMIVLLESVCKNPKDLKNNLPFKKIVT
ncbi:unnamed protein product [Cochlearia groenlandica]